MKKFRSKMSNQQCARERTGRAVPPEDKNSDEVDRTVNDDATQQFWISARRARRQQLVAREKGEKIKNTSQSDILLSDVSEKPNVKAFVRELIDVGLLPLIRLDHFTGNLNTVLRNGLTISVIFCKL